MGCNLWLFFISARILVDLVGPQAMPTDYSAELYDNQGFSPSTRVYTVQRCFVRRGTWFQGLLGWVALGWDSQPFVPICTTSPLSRFEAQTPWFCKPSHHTSEADLLFLSIKPLDFPLTAFLLVMRPSDV